MVYQKMDISSEAWKIGEAFLKAILLEVSSYPKPGLVTSRSNGAHNDMNILTFMVGSASVAPAFFMCAQAGINHKGELPELLKAIRNIGVQGEEQLLFGTKGVNTQRGVLFSSGLFCGAAGYLSRTTQKLEAEKIFDVVSAMTSGIVQRELENMDTKGRKLTAGEQLFLKYKARGIRGEVEDGFPSVRDAGLPAFREAIEKGIDLNFSIIHTLISLMTCVEDTTILWRTNQEMLRKVQSKSKEILNLGSVFTKEGLAAINRLDKEFIQSRISPGGSADLVSITIGSYLIEENQFPVPIL